MVSFGRCSTPSAGHFCTLFYNGAQTPHTVRDAWNALGWKIKADAAAIFGPDFLPVRSDLVNDTIGYRAPGIADLWSGVSRWSPEAQTKVRGMLIAVGGVDNVTDCHGAAGRPLLLAIHIYPTELSP